VDSQAVGTVVPLDDLANRIDLPGDLFDAVGHPGNALFVQLQSFYQGGIQVRGFCRGNIPGVVVKEVVAPGAESGGYLLKDARSSGVIQSDQLARRPPCGFAQGLNIIGPVFHAPIIANRRDRQSREVSFGVAARPVERDR
jgi:hypothetical protein